MKIMLRNSELTQCEQSVYLGGVISDDTNCDEQAATKKYRPNYFVIHTGDYRTNSFSLTFTP